MWSTTPGGTDTTIFDYEAEVDTPRIELLGDQPGAVVNFAGFDLVYDDNVTCDVIDDQKMVVEVNTELGERLFDLSYDATVPDELPNNFEFVGAGSAWGAGPRLEDYATDDVNLDWSRSGSTITGTATAFSRFVGKSYDASFVVVC